MVKVNGRPYCTGMLIKNYLLFLFDLIYLFNQNLDWAGFINHIYHGGKIIELLFDEMPCKFLIEELRGI
jgi:hypothetical protein